MFRIIGGVDYKGVREIMKAAIERLQTLSPGEIESVVSPQLSIVKVREFSLNLHIRGLCPHSSTSQKLHTVDIQTCRKR